MANLYLNLYRSHICPSQLACDLWKIEQADVADSSGFISQPLRDVLGYSFEGIRL